MRSKNIQFLEILLNDVTVGHLTHYQDGKNVFVFEQSYIDMGDNRPILSLSFTEKKLQIAHSTMIKLPPFFSNLLPEGALRQLICKQLKIHLDDEFSLLQALGNDLPGAVIAKSIDIPDDMSSITTKIAAKKKSAMAENLQFSLAGVQMKFSMQNIDGRLTVPKKGSLGHYIIKTPSNIHSDVPKNEYSMMQLAQVVGIEVPTTELIELHKLSGLPDIKLPQEKYAYLIQRFDRTENNKRIHIEDFAQVFAIRSNKKYLATNYDSMAKLIHERFLNNISQLEQFIKRIVFNILIGNSDAHLQNWSIIYHDQCNPQLAPAYDLVSTLPYIDDRNLALNFAKQKNFYAINEDSLRYFAKRIGVREKLVMSSALEVIATAKQFWPNMLETLPLTTKIKLALQQHWQQLAAPFDAIAG